MYLSTSQAAAELGVSARQLRRAATNGRVIAAKAGASHAFAARQVLALERTAHRGRDWSEGAQIAALDLLATGKTAGLSSSERSRLKARIRSANVNALAGQILRGRATLRRAASEAARNQLEATLSRELGLSQGGGLGVLIAVDAARAARRAHLGLDDEGDIAVVEGSAVHAKVLEALALYVYGDTRESSAAAQWIVSAKGAL